MRLSSEKFELSEVGEKLNKDVEFVWWLVVEAKESVSVLQR